MNKIFKIIWNHSTNRWTVASELAKGHSKASQNCQNTQEENFLASLQLKLKRSSIARIIQTTLFMGITILSGSSAFAACSNGFRIGMMICPRIDGHLLT